MNTPSQRLPAGCRAFAAVAAALVGLVNIASALTPNIRWRGHLLLDFEPVEAMRLFHALALPAGAALLLVAPYLLKRRRRAWQTAITLMLALGLFDLLKGLDFEETVDHLGARRGCCSPGRAFRVRHDPHHAALGGLAGAAARRARRAPSRRSRSGPRRATRRSRPSSRETGRPAAARQARRRSTISITTSPGSRWRAADRARHAAGDRLRDLPAAGRAAGACPARARRAAAAELVRAHGSDTLSFFKLRADKHYFFSEDRRAFVGYRIENGVLLLSGDPVGPDDALPGAARRAARVRRCPRPEAGRGRRQRARVPAVRGARAAHDLPRRRGDHRA